MIHIQISPFNVGHDSATVEIRQYVAEMDGQGHLFYDEIKSYLDARYVSSPEAVWRLLSFPMNDMSHTITRLAVHLPQEQIVHFQPGHEEAAVEKATGKDTTLTVFFKLNGKDETAHEFVYHEIPSHFVYAASGVNRGWSTRQRGGDRVLARMYAVSPRDRERYFLRTLLLHVKGPKSFDDLKTFNGTVYETYCEAAKARGLLRDDAEWSNCLEEAAMTQHPRQLRFLYAIICLHAVELTDKLALFEKYENDLSEDYRRELSPALARNATLREIEETFRINGKSCVDFGLPLPSTAVFEDETFWDIAHESSCGMENYRLLNAEQRSIVDKVLADISSGAGTAFFVSGPGGTGKCLSV